ncbi:hypothetical protein ITP53_22450 [Nonomuraea sp. K274]|uniref:Uncharacterized protein n=1 Tax=Nonomuraea cypriaca TaxID=1187855 RepID=A0A931F1S1_9ACTN|nr:hypothetical protein [Nonomuraea cypriaca]MBF8188436.1 hypothetical protein [Nonomuraea cypriaca]
MIRVIAEAVLSLYPRAWRQRYGAEVADLIASRPVRPRTVLDLVRGAADAWLRYRRLPGRGPVRIPLPLMLALAGAALWFLWSPGILDAAGLRATWAQASGAVTFAGLLQETASRLFVVAGLVGVLSVAPLLISAYAARNDPTQGLVTRATAQLVVGTGLVLAVPVALVFAGLAFGLMGSPAGPLGDAMTGGFVMPVILALVLGLPMTASAAPALGAQVRGSGVQLAVAAIFNGLAWLSVGALVVLGLPGESWTFVAVVAASAVLSVGMSAVVAMSALRRGRAMTGRLNHA